MNKFEFKEVLNVLKINNAITTARGRFGTDEEVYILGNIAFYFSGSYYTIVKGKVPLEVAKAIAKKDPNNEHKIRIIGSSTNQNPEKWAYDDILKKTLEENKNLSHDEFVKKYKLARLEMNKRSDEDKYIEGYHIDTKEGLVIFLTEMQDYYTRSNSLPETQATNFDQIMFLINNEIINKAKLSMTNEEWMANLDAKYSNLYLETLAKIETNPDDKKLKKALDSFDKSVNPYLSEDIEFAPIDEYLTRIKLAINVHNTENNQYKKDCCTMTIKEKNNENEVKYYRSPFGFSYQLYYEIAPNKHYYIYHYFTPSEKLEDNGEHIGILYISGKTKKIDINYNLTQGLVGETYQEKKPVTPEQINFIYSELTKGISLANKVTVENMQAYPSKIKLNNNFNILKLIRKSKKN